MCSFALSLRVTFVGPSRVLALRTQARRSRPLVLVVVSGRPMDLTAVRDEADAIVAAWLPGSEGGGIADLLFGVTPVEGRLSMPWGDDYPASHGLFLPPPAVSSGAHCEADAM